MTGLVIRRACVAFSLATQKVRLPPWFYKICSLTPFLYALDQQEIPPKRLKGLVDVYFMNIYFVYKINIYTLAVVIHTRSSTNYLTGY